MDQARNEKAQRWYLRIQEFQESSLSQTAWCKEKGIPTSSFQYWYKKIQGCHGQPEAGFTDWLEIRSDSHLNCPDRSVPCKHTAPVNHIDPITFSYGGFRMEISPDTPMETVQSMLRIMRSV